MTSAKKQDVSSTPTSSVASVSVASVSVASASVASASVASASVASSIATISSTATSPAATNSTVTGSAATNSTPTTSSTFTISSAATSSAATKSTAAAANATATSSTTASSKSNWVSPGTVAGVALGVGIGLALIAALTTFFFMRHQNVVRRSRDSRNQRQYEPSKKNSVKTKTKPALVGFDDYLPQPADDKAVQTKTKTFFDQVELFVENFCLVTPSSGAKVATAELTAFNSPYLSKSLAFSLSQAKDVRSLIKHSLAHYTTSRISPTAAIEDTLLPADLALLFGVTTVNASKPGFTKCLSRWRVVTAYIRPDPYSNRTYIVDRDRKIAHSVQSLIQAFAPWMNTKYDEQERAQALTAIFQEAAGLGIFLLSQPSELVFRWPQDDRLDPGRLAVTPALVKVTDEYGQILGQAQVLVGALVVD